MDQSELLAKLKVLVKFVIALNELVFLTNPIVLKAKIEADLDLLHIGTHVLTTF